jgi:hypothetical protein
MKQVLLVIIGLISLPLWGQIDDNNKLSIGIYYTPGISYRTLSESRVTPLRNETEIYKYGNSFGATFGYRINRRIEIETGVNFTNHGYQTKEQILIPQESDPNLPDKVKSFDRFYYLGIPLKCGFRKDFTLISFVSSIGVIPNYLFHQKTEYKLTKNEQVETITYDRIGDYNRFDLTAILSLGLAYKISHKMDLLIEPTFQHDLVSVMGDAPLEMYLWNLGLNLGIKYIL